LRAADTQSDGKISYQEFIAAASNKADYINNETLDRVFDMIDSDKSGYLESDELMILFSSSN